MNLTQEQRAFLRSRQEWITMGSRLSYFALACAVWMAASLAERMAGADWSGLLISWAEALELKVIFFVMLYIALRVVVGYYRQVYPDPDAS